MPRAMRGDEVRIKQVIMHLLTNAVKYTEKGSVTLKVGGKYVSADPYEMLVQEKHFDLIFMDHMMPELDGIETLERLKANHAEQIKDTVIIALTANAVAGAREEYIKAGFADYLSKPVNGEKLEAVVAKYLPERLILPGASAKNSENNSHVQC